MNLAHLLTTGDFLEIQTDVRTHFKIQRQSKALDIAWVHRAGCGLKNVHLFLGQAVHTCQKDPSGHPDGSHGACPCTFNKTFIDPPKKAPAGTCFFFSREVGPATGVAPLLIGPKILDPPLDPGPSPLLKPGPWTLDPEPWTPDPGPRTLNPGP